MGREPASAFANFSTESYERKISLKDSSVRSAFSRPSRSPHGFGRCESLATALYVRECEMDPQVKSHMDEGVIHCVHDEPSDGYFPRLRKEYISGKRTTVEIKSARHRGDVEVTSSPSSGGCKNVGAASVVRHI